LETAAPSAHGNTASGVQQQSLCRHYPIFHREGPRLRISHKTISVVQHTQTIQHVSTM